MDEKIRLIIEAQNRTNPATQAVVRGLGTIQTGAKNVGTAVGNAASNIRTAFSNISAAVLRAGGVFQNLGRTAHSALSSILSPLGALTRGLTLVGGALGGLSVVAFTKAGIDMNLTVDRATAALTKMTGSAQVASTFVEALRKEAETSAPTLAELLPIAQQLAAAYGNNGLGKVIPTIRAFGDAAVSLGAGTDGMSLALLGFRQMLGRDFPQQEELNQIRENLPGLDVNGILKRSFGTADTEALKDAGVTGQMVGDALVRGMEQAFGGSQAGGALKLPTLLSNFQDTFSRMAGTITLGLLRSLEGANGAVTKLLASFGKLAESSGFMGGVQVVFDGLGRAMEIAAAQGDKFVAWLDAVLSREGIALLLTNILALVQTIGQSIAQTFGIDLKAAMDPKNVSAFFDALAVAADQGISTFFGIGRVAQEVVRIGMSAFEDLGDHVTDIIGNVTRGFEGMFVGLQLSMASTTAMMLDNVSTVLRALSQVGIGKWRPFAGLEGAANDLSNQATKMRGPGGPISSLGDQQRRLAEDEKAAAAARKKRDADKLDPITGDPYRNDPFFKRIGDSFAGRPGQSGGEDAFRALLESNRMGIARALFSGATAQAPAMPFPSGPMLYGGGGGGRSSVSYGRSNVPMIPSLPDSMRPGYGATAGYTGDFIRNRDQGFQYGSGYGGGGVNVNVTATITRESMIAAAEEAYEEMVRRGIAGPGAF